MYVCMVPCDEPALSGGSRVPGIVSEATVTLE